MEEKASVEEIGEVSLRIPDRLLKEFGKEARIVLRRDIAGIWPIGPDAISKLKPEVLKEALNDYDLILVPKARSR